MSLPATRLSPEDERRVEGQLRLLDAVRESFPRTSTPWFGHMRLDTGLREMDVLLGAASGTAPALSMIEWQTAPLAEVFFAYEEGEPYEVDLGERVVTGRLLEKNLVAFSAGELVRVTFGGTTLRRESPEEPWQRVEGSSEPRIPPRTPAQRRPFKSPLEVELDATQRRAVELPDHRSVLLLGEAGFGKTTVALHRLVDMQARRGKRFRGAVMVPTEGLRRLTEHMLERRGAAGIDVWTYSEWASKMARRAFRQLPKRESENATTNVNRIKRHPALREVLQQFVRRRPRASKMEHASTKSETLATRADLEHLFGDSMWMDRVVELAGGAIPPLAVKEATQHTKIQFSDTSEAIAARAGFRADALETVDGRRIDEGTPMEDANSVDAEDYAVLFELERLRASAQGTTPMELDTYDCVVVDEAQEFAPIELALMRRSVKRGGTVIVAGDAAQRVDPTSFFGGWPEVMRELGAPDAEQVVLEVSYRCPPDVTEVARHIIDPRVAVPAETPNLTRARHEHLFHQATWLTDELRRLEAEDPSASITVITRSSDVARVYARALRHGTAVRLALGGEFEFRPGLTVTSVPEVKGLEFDYVVVPDANPSTYPETEDSRRALYVAVTRATHRLVLASATSGGFSSLTPSPSPSGRGLG